MTRDDYFNGVRVMSRLRQERRLDATKLATAIQKDESALREVLEKLFEAGLIEAHGTKRGRFYNLSTNIYQQVSQSGTNIHQAVMQYVNTQGKITRNETAELFQISEDQASRILRNLHSNNNLKLVGKGRGAYYTRP